MQIGKLLTSNHRQCGSYYANSGCTIHIEEEAHSCNFAWKLRGETFWCCYHFSCMHGRALRELKIKIIAPLTTELLTKQPFVSSWFLLFTIGKLCLPTVFETIYSSTAFQCLQALQNIAAQKREKNHFFSTSFWLLLFTFDNIANAAALLPGFFKSSSKPFQKSH